MDTRKLIKFGKNSFVISLPKDWLEANKLIKGSELYLDQQPASLTLTASETVRDDRIIRIQCDGKSTGVIENEFTSNYKAGATTIIFEGKSLPKLATKIKGYIHHFAGVEIVEQELHKIVVKDLIDMKQVALPTLINRMDMMVRSLLQDTLGKETIPPDVLRERDRDINRLQFLTARVVRHLLDNPALGNILGVSVIEAYYIDKVSWVIERIGDYVKRINEDIQRSRPAVRKELKELLRQLYEEYLATMKAYYTRSVEKAVVIHDRVIHFFPQLTERVLATKETRELLVLENIKNMVRDLRVILRATIEMGGKN